MSERIFHSVDEIMREFFPRRYEKERIVKMTSEELGNDIVQKILNEIREELKGE